GRIISGDVARSTRSRAAAVGRCGQCTHDFRVLSHTEIVIRAPNRDFPNGSVRPAPFGGWEAAGDAFDVGEDAITLLPVQALKTAMEMMLVRFSQTVVIVISERPAWRRQRSFPRLYVHTQKCTTYVS